SILNSGITAESAFAIDIPPSGVRHIGGNWLSLRDGGIAGANKNLDCGEAVIIDLPGVPSLVKLSLFKLRKNRDKPWRPRHSTSSGNAKSVDIPRKALGRLFTNSNGLPQLSQIGRACIPPSRLAGCLDGR